MIIEDCKVRMKVKCVYATGSPLKIGKHYTITNLDEVAVAVEEEPGFRWFPYRFEPVNEAKLNNISQPKHYTQRGGIEPIDFIESNNLNFLEGCIVKYVYRYPFKNEVEDLKKARFYLDALIQQQDAEDQQ